MMAHSNTSLVVIKITNVPNGAKVRELRKAIGVAAKAIRRDPPIRFGVEVRKRDGVRYGKVSFTEPEIIKLWLARYGSRLGERLVVQQQPLMFEPTEETIDKWQVSAINNQIKDRQWEGSDYDDIPEPPRLSIVDVSCGAWDASNAFCTGYKRLCRDPRSCMTFDVDETRLRICFDGLVIETVAMNIQHIYVVGKALYIEMGHTPLFLREVIVAKKQHLQGSVGANGEPSNDRDLRRARGSGFRQLGEYKEEDHENVEYDRVGAFDDQHMPVAPYCAVFRVGACTVQEIKTFYDLTQRRMPRLKRVSSMALGDSEAFSEQTIHNLNKMFQKLPFEVAFQAQALIGPRLLPLELLGLKRQIYKLEERLGPAAASALRSLKALLCDRGPLAEKEKWPTFTLEDISRHLERVEKGHTFEAQLQTRHKTLTHTVHLTPSYGCFLEGPHLDDGNRVLRQFPGQDNNFLRVRCIEENGSVLRVTNSDIRSKAMIEDRFGRALRKEIVVAGRTFRFLAFSGSSLRESSCWFMRTFTFEGQRITADIIRQGIGALDHIRCPAKYAARMGQAFTATPSSIDLRPEQIKRIADVERDNSCFTDGVGTISPALLERVITAMYDFEPPTPPTVFQVRLGGAKGVLAVDTRLEGEQVNLRKSMIKFEATSTRLEIANVYPKPLPMFLNRPMVALLESLGVPKRAFMALQNAAVRGLRDATQSIEAAKALHLHYGMGLVCSEVLTALGKVSINGLASPFLREANLGLVNYALRNVKYKARIQVPNCYTLLGATDETSALSERQVVVAISWPGEPTKYLEGCCLVGRSPMTAPGDVQYVTAVVPAPGSPLLALRNCVIFSQHGNRSLPSMLAGGDLDGDLYNVIQEPSLMPKVTYKAAAYPRLKPKELDRNCTVDDMITFFLQFIEDNVIGVVASHHLHLSDRSNKGVVDRACVRLAALHSIAVDYSKSGIPAPLKASPYVPAEKPDYFLKEFRLEGRDNHQQPRERDLFYQSRKALGDMFRAIDVQDKLAQWSRTDMQPVKKDEIKSGNGDQELDWSPRLWEELSRDDRGKGYKRSEGSMKSILEYYERNIDVLRRDYSPLKKSWLTEGEIFMGCIIERGPTQQTFNDFDNINRLQDEYQSICKITKRRVFFPSLSTMSPTSATTASGTNGTNGTTDKLDSKKGSKINVSNGKAQNGKGADPSSSHRGNQPKSKANGRSKTNGNFSSQGVEHRFSNLSMNDNGVMSNKTGNEVGTLPSSNVVEEESIVSRWILHGNDRHDDDIAICSEVQCVASEKIAHVSQELLSVIGNGLAFYKIALEKSIGKSAPWIVVPGILRAHRYLDAVEGKLSSKKAMRDSGNVAGFEIAQLLDLEEESAKTESEESQSDEGRTGNGLAPNNEDLMLGLRDNVYEGMEMLDGCDGREEVPSPAMVVDDEGHVKSADHEGSSHINKETKLPTSSSTDNKTVLESGASEEEEDDEDEGDFGFEAFTRKEITQRGGGAYMTSDEEDSSDDD